MPNIESPPEEDRPEETKEGVSDLASSRDAAGLRLTARFIGLLIVLAAVTLGIYVTHLYYVYPRTDDAYVRANVVGVAAHVSGPIVEMPIEDNQRVAQGQLLFVVDPRP